MYDHNQISAHTSRGETAYPEHGGGTVLQNSGTNLRDYIPEERAPEGDMFQRRNTITPHTAPCTIRAHGSQ